MSESATAASPRSARSGRRRPPRRSTARGCTSFQASSTRRCISASRALPTRKTSRRAASRPSWAASRRCSRCRTPSRSRRRRKRSRPRSRRAVIACIAISPSTSEARARTLTRSRGSKACRARPASRFSWGLPQATCLSTTRSRSPVSSPRRAGARPFIPRTRRASSSGRACGAGATRPRTPSGATSRRRWSRRSALCASPRSTAAACTCCTSRPPRRWNSWPPTAPMRAWK